MISVFTCTHAPKDLERAELSLFKQSNHDFEWVLVLNNGAKYSPKYLTNVTVVDLHDAPRETIGWYKKIACEYASGELLVELDHDDQLTPDCLSTVAASYEADKWDFAFSNFLELNAEPNGTFISTKYPGWQHRPFHFMGKMYFSCVAKPCNPENLQRIETTPNHVRVWNRQFYDQIGGHDATLSICDDQDLVCRSYLNGKCHHIDECLYVYYRDGSNTSLDPTVNRRIRQMTSMIGSKYFPEIA